MTRTPNDAAPRLARWLASIALPAREREFVLGDLEEGFHDRLASSAARRWYWRETLNLFTTRWPRLPRVTQDLAHRPGASPMSSFRNEVRIAIRSLGRAPLYSSLAIVTAAVGIGASTAIFSVAKPIVFDAAP